MKKRAIAAVGAGLLSLTPAHGEDYFDPLTLAAIRGDAAQVEVLLDAGAEPNDRSWLGLTPLAAAMRSCRMSVPVLEVLVAGGADVNAPSGAGETPLMFAWRNGRPDLAEALLAAGADPEARNMYGDTAAQYRDYFSGDLPMNGFATLSHALPEYVPKSQDAPAVRCP